MFLYKVECAVSVVHVEEVVKKFLNRFFKEYNLPMPRIKIVNNVGSKWLGRDSYIPKVDKSNTTLEIQKRITEDEKTLDRVVLHELIHHKDFIEKFTHPEHGESNYKKTAQLHKLGIKDDGHGKEFKEWADKINMVMGKDFVTEKSSDDYVITTNKEFFVLIYPVNKEKLGWAWTARPSPEQKEVIKEKITEGARLFTTKDAMFAKGAKLKKYGGWSIPREADKDKVKELYMSGKQVKV